MGASGTVSPVHQPQQGPTPVSLVTAPPFTSCSGDEYVRLLREAQRESNQSSARVSIAGSSRRDTPRGGSPKSPPNSPNTELTEEIDIVKGYYINKELESTDWVWDWSSRPDQAPPKDWRFRHPSPPLGRRSYSMRHAKVGKTSLFSREVLYTLLLTNVLSLIIGAGIGVWLCRRGAGARGALTAAE
ncbi:hypothetical protein B566_EDAN002082 [Ephemera danica]|nr:hypothetical protein B566_EDAN002082 [Ephemera danica]